MEKLEQLETRTPEQLVELKEKKDKLVRWIKDADKMHQDWRQLDYYRTALDKIEF